MAGPTQKSGTISADETWTKADSPYEIVGNLTVATGVALQIEPGVEVVAQGNYVIDVIGRLVAGGRQNDRIVFRSATDARASWVGIKFSHVLSAPSVLEYVDILSADIAIDYDLEQTVSSASHQLIRVRLLNGRVGLRTTKRYIALADSVVEGNEVGVQVLDTLANSVDPSVALGQSRRGLFRNRVRDNDVGLWIEGTATLTVTDGKNRIYGNRTAGARIANGGALSAAGNWWGADDGPDDSGATAPAYTPLNGSGDVLVHGADPAAVIAPVLALGRYVPRVERYRDFLGQIVKRPGIAETNLELVAEEELEQHLIHAEQTVDGWFDDRAFAAETNDRLFAYGTATEEAHNWSRTGKYQMRFWPIVSVTSGQVRSSNTGYTNLTANSEYGGWYAGSDDLRKGVIRAHYWRPAFRANAFRFTYVHGFAIPPDWLQEIAMRVAAKESLQSILSPALGSALADRQRLLDEEIKRFSDAAKRKRRNYVVMARGSAGW